MRERSYKFDVKTINVQTPDYYGQLILMICEGKCIFTIAFGKNLLIYELQSIDYSKINKNISNNNIEYVDGFGTLEIIISFIHLDDKKMIGGKTIIQKSLELEKSENRKKIDLATFISQNLDYFIPKLPQVFDIDPYIIEL